MIPPAELATIVRPGPRTGIDRTYGALGAYVTQHALAVHRPIDEYYLVGPSETRDESLWRTEVGWPIFEARHRRQQSGIESYPPGKCAVPAGPRSGSPELNLTCL